MKKNTASRIACKEAQLETVSALIPFIPWPVEVAKPDGTVILHNRYWDENATPGGADLYELFVYGLEKEHLFNIRIYKPTQESYAKRNNWEESAKELKKGLSTLVEGWRVPLPPPDPSDPLADVKKEFNSALETIERLISVSKLF